MTNALADEIERQTKDRDAADITLELEQWQQIIAALRRQPSSDQVLVLVPREPTEKITRAGESCYMSHQQDFSSTFWLRTLIEKLYRAMLAAAEAEGRKP